MISKVKVSGNIISELSEKIPSNIIALNELIKNSYDAGAKKVTVKIDSVNQMLYITDDGSGMDKEDIDTLFHISKSDKKYGVLNQYNRITQGSKGLGFLSVFKFGENVVWKTKKIVGMQFSVNYSDIISSDDLSQYQVEIIESDKESQGTEIEISLTEYNTNSLLEYFSDEKNYLKIVHALDDKDYIIELKVDKDEYSNANIISLDKCLPDRQLYYVKYDSAEQKLNYYHNGYLAYSENHVFDSKQYALEIELVIYNLRRGDKSKITKLFYNPQDELTPLIYINGNFFNNYDLFDPNVLAKTRIGSMLNQMIGYIRVKSSDHMINFNSDRTQFLQNQLTDDIKGFIQKINIQIQTIGSKYKKYLMDLDFLNSDKLLSKNKNENIDFFKSFIFEDFKFKPRVKIEKDSIKVVFSIFGKSRAIYFEKDQSSDPSSNLNNNNIASSNNNDPNKDNQNGSTTAAFINLKKEKLRLPIPSAQIILSEEILDARNSKGEPIPNDLITIKVDNTELTEKILSSINIACTKKVEYLYEDKVTGLVLKKMVLEFYQPEAKFETSNDEGKLFSLPTATSYTISFNPSICNLINQLNRLKLDDYSEVISCCLRSLFEISIDSLNKSGKFPHLSIPTKSLEDDVAKVIEYVNKSNNFITEINKQTLIDYKSLKNLLISNDFRDAIKKAHLGAHKSTTYISESDLKNLSKKDSIFVAVVNEMIINPNIT